MKSDHPISAVHGDIIATHVLPRLDGVSLSSFASSSSEFRSIVGGNERRLWSHVTTSTWPSTEDPCVQSFIASLPGCHRGFFSKCFPLLTGHVISNRGRSIVSKELISAVDVYYKNELVFSRVHEMETSSGWFNHFPFRVDLLGSKESFCVKCEPHQPESDLSKNLKVSWIIIDPIKKTTANLSTFDAVATEKHWLTGEISIKYSTIINVDRLQQALEIEVKGVLCAGETRVTDVGMRVEDMEGKWLNGKGSLGILESVMECGVRKIDRGGFMGKKRYEKYLEMKRFWRVERERMERNAGLAFITFGVLMLVGFCFCCIFVL